MAAQNIVSNVGFNTNALAEYSILSDILKKEKYPNDLVMNLAINNYLYNEMINIAKPSNLHLITMKKILLYAYPVIATNNKGVKIKTRTATECYVLDSKKFINVAVNDEIVVIGFYFKNPLINKLPIDINPYKFIRVANATSASIPNVKHEDTKTQHVRIHIIKDYEKPESYNEVLKLLNFYLQTANSLAVKCMKEYNPTAKVQSLDYLNKSEYIDKLNKVLSRQINPTFSANEFEIIPQLYELISLYSFSSNIVKDRISQLDYEKSQNELVLKNKQQFEQTQLNETRADKISRDLYPWMFDITHKNHLFTKFKRFSLDRVPAKEQKHIRTLLKKELDEQNAILNNKCEHLNRGANLLDFVGKMDEHHMYMCKICEFPLMCEHSYELTQIMNHSKESDDINQDYIAHTQVINKYRDLVQIPNGQEDTESLFTYVCKFCGGTLGQSDEIVQVSVKDRYGPTTRDQLLIEYEQHTFLFMKKNINPIIPYKTLLVAIAPVVYDELVLHDREWSDDKDYIKTYLMDVMTLSAIIVLNVHSLKSGVQLIEVKKGGKTAPTDLLKKEFQSALTLLSTNKSYLSIPKDSMKNALVQYYKMFLTKLSTIVPVVYKTKTLEEKSLINVHGSPMFEYCRQMVKLFNNGIFEDNASYIDGIKEINETKLSGRKAYIAKSFNRTLDYIKTIQSSELPKDMIEYEKELNLYLTSRTHNPIWFMEVINTREYKFELASLNLGYCSNGDLHKWKAYNINSKLVYKCKLCDEERQSNPKLDQLIMDAIDDNILRDAFFEMYNISCPIKDAHLFETSDNCSQCGASKNQLEQKDIKYFKKYLKTFLEYQSELKKDLINSVTEVKKYNRDYKDLVLVKQKLDMDLLGPRMSTIDKLFNVPFSNIATIDGVRSDNIMRSYIKLFYERWTFIKNLTIGAQHWDSEFNKFIKKTFYNGMKLNRPTMPDISDLHEFPNVEYSAEELMMILCDIINSVLKTNQDLKPVLNYLINKIISQDTLSKQFDFAKLKSSMEITDEEFADEYDDDDEEEEDELFDGYDLDGQDDNIDGSYD